MIDSGDEWADYPTMIRNNPGEPGHEFLGRIEGLLTEWGFCKSDARDRCTVYSGLHGQVVEVGFDDVTYPVVHALISSKNISREVGRQMDSDLSEQFIDITSGPIA